MPVAVYTVSTVSQINDLSWCHSHQVLNCQNKQIACFSSNFYNLGGSALRLVGYMLATDLVDGATCLDCLGNLHALWVNQLSTCSV